MIKRITSALVILITGIAGALLVMSCSPVSLSPLSDPKNATYDPRLAGAWRSPSDDGTTGFLHIGKMEGNLTKVICIEHKEGGELKHSVLAMFPTAIDRAQYMNIIFDEVSTGIPKEIKGYTFAKYDFTENDNGLLVSLISLQAVADAINTGQLKGTLKCKAPAPPAEDSKGAADQKTEESLQCAVITDTPENIIKFIRAADPGELFANPVRLERVR